jgi:tetratricopeptide (TPR) repeat protein
LHPTIAAASFEWLLKLKHDIRLMKRNLALWFAAIVTLFFLQFALAQGKSEAANLARQCGQAAKEQNWDRAIDLCRKAADLDRKFTPNLAIAYEQRGFALQKEQKLPQAIADFTEAVKLSPRDARIYEQRAAAEMKNNAHDQALADYSEAIKLNPNEIRYYLYRSYIYEVKRDTAHSMADTERALKIQPSNAEALARKERLQKMQASQMGLPPAAPQTPSQSAPAKTP